MHVIYRKTCRVCGSPALTKVIDLGEQYLQGSFVKAGKEMPPLRKIPTSLVRCDPTMDEKACGLLQLAHTLPPEVLYSAYWYRSGTNETMRRHLQEIAEDAVSLVRKDNAIVLDIGCNDGTLLYCYPKSYKKYGIDPSDVAREITGEIDITVDTFPSEELSKKLQGRKFDIVTSIAMFYDLEDPVAFVASIKDCLAEDGLWIFELSYMPAMLKLNSYDTICHEHLEYYSLAVLERIVKQAGMKMVKVALNDINGGSIRCYATHKTSFKFASADFSQTLARLRTEEFDAELDSDKPYAAFQQRIVHLQDQLTSLLKFLKWQGKRIHVYGASTKGNTILQWCGIDKSIIDCAADRNPDKHGARTLGTDIPIVSEEESRAMNPDYYLVLPWHFRKAFLEREKEMLKRGVGLIFPLPTVEVVKDER
ncbi:MAG: class I SAM-dependent methyltransferase [Betaproteobacteria bacterium]|nr:MAG: class I SAM-dependent methyltransferase [Betaproteobacteria bacterium]